MFENFWDEDSDSDVSGVVLVFLLLNVNMFYTLL